MFDCRRLIKLGYNVSILDINLHDVKDDEEKVQEAFGMGKFIATFLFGFNRKTSAENTQK